MSVPVARTCEHPRVLWVVLAASLASCAPYRDELFTIDAPSGAGDSGRVTTPTDSGGAGAGGKAATATAGAATTVPPVAGSTAAGSAAQPGTDLNPSVNFDWPTTIPGAGLCRPKEFTGAFSCKISTIFVNEMLEGSILLVLAGSSESQQLTVPRGQVLVFDEDMSGVLTANVSSGSLDCSQQLLNVTAGPAQTEILTIDRQLAWLVSKPQPQVTVTLVGSLDRNGQIIQGDIDLAFEDPSDTTCSGTFSVQAGP